jgi:NDP-sugar pyrophosphorylase family protein
MKDTQAVLLVGGMGTRLRTVMPSTPKPLAPVGDRPIRQLRGQGIRRMVMCSGYLADQVEEQFGSGSSLGVEIRYSKESEPLGTAGAVKLAQKHLEDGADFIVMNGDSFLEVDLHQVMSFHRERRGLASMATVRVENAGRYGTVVVNPSGEVVGFTEKTDRDGPGLVNAGVYVFSPALLNWIPDGPGSLERDVFPRLLGHGLYAIQQHGVFIDIGTPEDYTRAQVISDRLFGAAS